VISEHEQEQASLYALGALTPSERQAFEAELATKPELLDLTRSLQSALAVFVDATIPAKSPPPDLKDKVLHRIEESARGGERIPVPPAVEAGLRFVAGADQSGWKPLPIPGAFIKLLSLERERGYAVLLGKLEAGASYPAHVNTGPEDFYILTGDLVIGDRKLVAGDFHHAERGSQHEMNYSMDGCTLIAVLTTDDPLVAYALAS
jgi:anti-sigma factor ChrR (cupin superfamily)